MYLDENVREMAEQRIRYFIEEFDRICVNVSGGKDSTVVFEMTYSIAKEMGELPIYCMWIDQEAEYESTVETVDSWMRRDGVKPVWIQCPMLMTNATSDEDDFLKIWNPDEEDIWMREKSDISIKENTYGTKRFTEIFEEILYQHVADERDDIHVGAMGGVRAEESPNRYLGMTTNSVYKGVTYGKTSDYENINTYYPIYDWTYSDVWKYIHENDIEYNDVYDAQYQHGVPIREMRVSNLNHETAIRHLFWLQELEPDTWNKMSNRLNGAHMANQMGQDQYVPEQLPYMFKDWREYRNYLLDKMVDDPEHELGFKREFFTQDLMCEHLDDATRQRVHKGHVRGILTNDWEATTVLANTREQVSYPEHNELMKAKKEQLRKQKPEVWNELYEEGVVQYPTEGYSSDDEAEAEA
jgi:predicted phosphoadenosine phosphosulfate sulfurtransferase